MGWNMFITVVAYWNYKFRTIPLMSDITVLAVTSNVTDDVTDQLTVLNGTTPADPEPNEMQKAWGGYLAVASMVPNVTFLILNGVVGHKFRTQPRLVISLVFVILSFIFTSVMVQVDTDGWQST